MNLVIDPALQDDLDDIDATEEAQDFSYALSSDVHVSLERRDSDLVICFGDPAPYRAVIDEFDWSLLCLRADDPRALESEQVVGFFDALVDGTLLDEFDRVLVLGHGALAGPALGYSVCAALARVVILAPRGPLHDGDRYAPSPATLAAADRVQVIYDPMDADSADAARAISERGAELLPMRFGESTDVLDDLNRLDVMEPLLEEAMSRDLNRLGFFRILRARRSRNPYLRRLNARLIAADRRLLRALTLRHIGQKLGRKRYLKEFERLSAELAQDGVAVPAARG